MSRSTWRCFCRCSECSLSAPYWEAEKNPIVKDNKGKYILCGVKSNYLSNIIFDDNNILISYDYLINKDKNNEETNQNKTIQWIAPYYEYSYSLDYKDFNETWFFDKELAIKELKRRNKNDL